MSPLRQRMIQDMQLTGFSARTQECYAAAPSGNWPNITTPARTDSPRSICERRRVSAVRSGAPQQGISNPRASLPPQLPPLHQGKEASNTRPPAWQTSAEPTLKTQIAGRGI